MGAGSSTKKKAREKEDRWKNLRARGSSSAAMALADPVSAAERAAVEKILKYDQEIQELKTTLTNELPKKVARALLKGASPGFR